MQKRDVQPSLDPHEGEETEPCIEDTSVLLTLQVPVLTRLDAIVQILFSAGLIADVLPRLWERSPQEGRIRQAELTLLTHGALAEVRGLLLELRLTEPVEIDPSASLIQKEP